MNGTKLSVNEQYRKIYENIRGGNSDNCETTNTKIREIALHDKLPDQVCVTIPWLFVNVDDDRGHRLVDSHNIINYDVFCKLMEYAPRIETGENQAQVNICSELVRKINNTDTGNISDNGLGDVIKNTEKILDAFALFSKIHSDMDLDDSFVDITYESITFDPIRVYENDPETNLLISAKETTINGISFYSQLGVENEMLKLEIRKQTNEDDLNQMYYTLEKFKESMLFQRTRICNNSSKLFNMCILFLAIQTNSTPISGRYLANLYTNTISYMFDILLRSRIIQYWYKYPCTRQLLADLVKNYSKTNPMVNICKFNNAKDRANFVIKHIRDSKECVLLKNISYSFYEKFLNESTMVIAGETFYNFNETYLRNMLQQQSFEFLIGMTQPITNS